MKQGLTLAHHCWSLQPQLWSLLVSVGLHGMVVGLIVAGTWLWEGAPFKRSLSPYNVMLVDAPLSLNSALGANSPSLPVKALSSKVSGLKPALPLKPVAPSTQAKSVKPKSAKPKSAKPKSAKPKSAKPKPVLAKVPPSKMVRSVGTPKLARSKPKKRSPGLPQTSKTSAAEARLHAPAKRLTATSAEAESTLAKMRQRQAKQKRARQQAETVAEQVAAQRLADLRQRVSQDDEVGRLAVQAVGLQQVRLAAYQERLRASIVNAWVLPLPPEQSRELRATAFFRVLSDGRVDQLSLVQSSGNTLFDASLMRAIKRASPLSPLPPDYPDDVLEVEMRFRAQQS